MSIEMLLVPEWNENQTYSMDSGDNYTTVQHQWLDTPNISREGKSLQYLNKWNTTGYVVTCYIIPLIIPLHSRLYSTNSTAN